jgi:hypothetical protein
MTNAKELLKNIALAEEEAKLDPSQAPPNVAAGVGMRKARGQENYYVLTQEYRKWVENESGATIILKGDKEAQLKWAKLAETVGNTITVNARQFYDSLCSGFWAAQGGRGVVSYDEVTAVQRRMDDLLRKVGITKYVAPALGFMFQYNFANEEEISLRLAEIIRKTGGDDFNTVILRMDAVKRAFEAKRDDPVVPVVVLNAIEGEDKVLADRLFGSRSIVVEVNNEPTEKEVIATFKQLKSILKKTKENKETNNG